MSCEDLIKQTEARRPAAWELLGVGAVSYDQTRDRAVIEWHAEPRHCHSTEGHPKGGIVQGGIVTGWLDAAMATASLLRGEYLITVASLEIKVAFLLVSPDHVRAARPAGDLPRNRNVAAFASHCRALRRYPDVYTARRNQD
jgi:acyl-CoA thioesterase